MSDYLRGLMEKGEYRWYSPNFFLVPRLDVPGWLVTDSYPMTAGIAKRHVAEGKSLIIRQLKALGCVEKHLGHTAWPTALWTPGEDEENSGEFEDTSGGYFLLGRYRNDPSETFIIPNFKYINNMRSSAEEYVI
jgi:hypothetical protein